MYYLKALDESLFN